MGLGINKATVLEQKRAMQLNSRHPCKSWFGAVVPFGADNLERKHRFDATLPLSFYEIPLAQSLYGQLLWQAGILAKDAS